MEDVYTIKVKTKPDTRNLYPSERRYSASTVSGLAWVHIALAATSFLLACLALVNPSSDIKRLNVNDTETTTITREELLYNLTALSENITDSDPVAFSNSTDSFDGINADSNYMLVLAATLLTVFALGAGLASIMASVRWYVDRNITWLFIMSVLSTLVALTSFVMVATWFGSSNGDIRDFYRESDDFNDYFVVKHSDVIAKNGSHIVIRDPTNSQATEHTDSSHLFSKRVLSINILIACFLELLWSILSVKISFKGMRSHYKDDEERRGNCISVVTTIKGNNTKNLPRNGKLIAPKPDLIENYPNTRIKRIFLAQNDEGYYLKHQNNAKPTETSTELYKERMMNFLNRCGSLEALSNPETSPQSTNEAQLNVITEAANIEVNETPEGPSGVEEQGNVTPVSWGDSPDHTIYNQNTLNLEKLFHYGKQKPEKTEDVD